ncbi:MAG: phospholipase A [Gammaproteobacteria bacterium]|nr:phospholipase A [Gammaproteobacteria bacterium]
MPQKNIIPLFLLFLSINSQAENNCLLIEDDMARLNCFEKNANHVSNTSESSSNDIDDIVSPKERFEYLTQRKPFKITPYEPIYFMPVAYTSHPNNDPFTDIGGIGLENYEAKFQLSTRFKITDDILHKNGDLWFGYTQKSFWQLYNDSSSPFRETNYKPELWFSLQTAYDFMGMTNRFIDFGITHESNGRGLSLSRSWNRAYIRFGLEKDNLALFFMPWTRIHIDDTDDNPNIEDYVGKAEIKALYQKNDRIIAAIVRNNFDFKQNRGSYELNWVFPMSGNLKGMLQYFNGYGESLIDYNIRMKRISLGLVIINWL